MDISGWSLTGDTSFTFRPGTVVGANDVLTVAGDILQFKKSYGGQGKYVVGPLASALSTSTPSIQIVKAA